MALSVSDIRTRVIERIQELSGWTLSRFHPDLFGNDTRDLSRHCFTVACPSTTWLAKDRQRISEGTLVETEFEIRFSYPFPSDGVVSDSFNTALDTEHTLLVHLENIDLTDMHFTFISANRTFLGDGKYFISTLRFIAQHRLSLS